MRHISIRPIAAAAFLLATVISIPSCTEDYFNFDNMQNDFVTWEPDIAFPIVHSKMGAEDIISLSDSTNIYQYGSDNFITLIYRRTIFSQTVNEFFQLPVNQSLDRIINLTSNEIGTLTGSGQVQAHDNNTLLLNVLGPGGSQLDKVIFQSGNMNISFTSNFEKSGSLLVSMPELRLNGTPFSQTYAINYQGGPVSVSIDIPLQGYEMDLDNGGPANSIPIDYTLTLDNGLTGAVPTPANLVQINHSFSDMVMAFADGDFGNFSLTIYPADVDLDVLQSDHGGYLYFEDPRFRLNVTNTIGAEMNVSIVDLYATGNSGQTDVDVSSLIPGNQFLIPGAPAVGDSSTLSYYFTQNNSNIKTLINADYDQIHHDFDAEVNPNGPAYNFATLNSAVEVTADVELPFWGLSNHFTIIDTVKVPFDEGSDYRHNIEKGLLRINTVSHFPVDGILILYFADSLYNKVDSVLTDGSYIIMSGDVNSDGRTISSRITNNDIPLDTNRIDNLFASSYLFIKADLTTTDDAGRNIKLYTDDNIEIHIGLRVKLKGSPSDLP